MARIRWRSGLAMCAGAAAAVGLAGPAAATEGGASVYLLGSGGPGAAIPPPVEGVFLANTLYHYQGKAGGDVDFPLGGNVVAGLKGAITADFATVLWVPSTNLAGGTFAVGAALPVGSVNVDVNAVLSGPLGNSVSRSLSDNIFTVGDPIVLGSLAWKRDNTYLAASTMVNIPIGDYARDGLANLAFHRWAVDASLAVTWHDPKVGWDLSGKGGVTFNGENTHTNYNSGNELHLEAAAEKTFNRAFSAGVQGYYLKQITGDSGSGARLGPFKGEVTGIGATAAYNFEIAGKIPATLRLHGVHEFDATNRMQGSAFWLDFNMPLWVPKAAAAAPKP